MLFDNLRKINTKGGIITETEMKTKRIQVFLKTLEEYIKERKAAKKVARVERIIYVLLRKPNYTAYELEIAGNTGIHPTDVSATLKKLEKENWVFIKSLGNGKRSEVTLNMKKLLWEGLPPRNDYEWKVLKFLNENHESSSTREIYSKVWKRSAGLITHEWQKNPFFILPHLYRVLKIMRKKGLILVGKNVVALTEKGKIAFEAYRKKYHSQNKKIIRG